MAIQEVYSFLTTKTHIQYEMFFTIIHVVTYFNIAILYIVLHSNTTLNVALTRIVSLQVSNLNDIGFLLIVSSEVYSFCSLSVIVSGNTVSVAVGSSNTVEITLW